MVRSSNLCRTAAGGKPGSVVPCLAIVSAQGIHTRSCGLEPSNGLSWARQAWRPAHTHYPREGAYRELTAVPFLYEPLSENTELPRGGLIASENRYCTPLQLCTVYVYWGRLASRHLSAVACGRSLTLRRGSFLNRAAHCSVVTLADQLVALIVLLSL